MADCRVWSKFIVKSKSCDDIIKLRIQDMPTDRFDEVFDLFTTYFSREETLHIASGLPENEEALKELNGFIRDMLTASPHHITICCLDDTNDVGTILGASIMKMVSKDEPMDEGEPPKFKEVAKLFELMDELYNVKAIEEIVNSGDFYDDRGIVVHPSYRGLGIAQEFFRIRRLVCKDAMIPMTGAWVTSYASQKACTRDGWETVYEIPYEELEKKKGVKFENVPPTCKFMIARV